ncbi:MAG: 6-carboxytetrahydropterin synthase [Phycisphaerales bacterium]|nr:6-carboxytetrahydropterin synthase [Phycisphaerales bacterium]
MYEIVVEGEFSATHQLTLADGSVEPLHGHDWHVWVRLESSRLDAWGMVADFMDVERALRAVLQELHHADLNGHAWFAGVNPTAEQVARVVFERMSAAAWTDKLRSVRVREAPGCTAAYTPRPASAS